MEEFSDVIGRADENRKKNQNICMIAEMESMRRDDWYRLGIDLCHHHYACPAFLIPPSPYLDYVY